MSLGVSTNPAAARRRPPLALPDVGGLAAWVFGAVTLASCVGAFVGLSASSWWTDELFTLFLIDHHGGAAEVLRRALTDTQPPGYYVLLYGWSGLFGLSETALRSLSACLAVTAIGVFWRLSRTTFSVPATWWASAVGATSPLWFVQSQNIRNYSLCLLLMAVMLAMALRLRRRVRAGCAWPWASWAALTTAGALDAATHFYGLLGFGAILLTLIVSLPSWRLRAALAASGLVVALGEGAYVHLLVGRTHEDFQHLWFRKDPGAFASVIYDVWKLGVGGAARVAVVGLIAVSALAAALHRGSRVAVPQSAEGGDAAWLVAVCAFVLTALYLGGVAVSLLFAPSLSDRNVLTAAPAAWVLLAGLYDSTLKRLDAATAAVVGLACGALLVFHAVAIGRGRGLSRNEPWRETARYVAGTPSCRGEVLDAVQPDKFGPDTPFYRLIARRYFFGRYLGDRWTEVHTHVAAAFTNAALDPDLAGRLAVRSHDPASCPILAWAVHDVDTARAVALRQGLLRVTGVAPTRVRLRAFPQQHLTGDVWRPQPAGYVIERVDR